MPLKSNFLLDAPFLIKFNLHEKKFSKFIKLANISLILELFFIKRMGFGLQISGC